MTVIDSLFKELQSHDEAPAERLRLQRLETALNRIDAENFGKCFKCEQPIPMSILRIHPERTICADCLDGRED